MSAIRNAKVERTADEKWLVLHSLCANVLEVNCINWGQSMNFIHARLREMSLLPFPPIVRLELLQKCSYCVEQLGPLPPSLLDFFHFHLCRVSFVSYPFFKCHCILSNFDIDRLSVISQSMCTELRNPYENLCLNKCKVTRRVFQ